MTSHKHIYGSSKLARITKIDNKLYNGTAGDKAFIIRTCECKHGIVVDYGPYNDMKEKLDDKKSTETLQRYA